MSISKKVIIAVLTLILPLNIVMLYITDALIDTTVEQVRSAQQGLADAHIEHLNMRIKNANALLYYFSTQDNDCIQMMRQQEGDAYTGAKMKFYASLKHMAYMTDGADGYFYYLQEKADTIFYANSKNSTAAESYILDQLTARSMKQGWEIRQVEGRQYLLFVFHANSVSYGAWIDLEEVRQDVLSGLEAEKYTVSFSRDQEIPKEQESEITAVSDSKYGVCIRISQERQSVLRGIRSSQKMLQFLAAICLVSLPLLYLFLRRYLLKPLRVITQAHRRMQSGELDYRISEKGNSPEYAEVFSSFNLMADNLKTYRIESYQKEIARQRLELQNLQLQIRPHFLLNTFNLLYALIRQEKNTPAGEIILYLSEYFRFLFRSQNDLIPFSQELVVIRGYSQTAAIRYNNRVRVDIAVSAEAERVCTPPLLIHNFIENAVKHGVPQDHTLHITLRGEYRDGFAVFTITDDGNGMDRQTLLRNQMIFRGELSLEDQNAHVGLYNAYKRLQLFYGEQAVIAVESEPGEMTRFTVRFPYRLEDDHEPAAGE